MSRDKDVLKASVDRLEQILSQLDAVDANIAAIHIDMAIEELCQFADIDRPADDSKAA